MSGYRSRKFGQIAAALRVYRDEFLERLYIEVSSSLNSRRKESCRETEEDPFDSQ